MLVAVVLCFVVTELPQGVLTIYRYIARDFLHLIFDTRPSAILDFRKCEFPTAGMVRRAHMRYHAKFYRNHQSNRCGDVKVLRFSKWRLSVILDNLKLKLLTADAPARG